jgi:hypothetical protein
VAGAPQRTPGQRLQGPGLLRLAGSMQPGRAGPVCLTRAVAGGLVHTLSADSDHLKIKKFNQLDNISLTFTHDLNEGYTSKNHDHPEEFLPSSLVFTHLLLISS